MDILAFSYQLSGRNSLISNWDSFISLSTETSSIYLQYKPMISGFYFAGLSGISGINGLSGPTLIKCSIHTEKSHREVGTAMFHLQPSCCNVTQAK